MNQELQAKLERGRSLMNEVRQGYEKAFRDAFPVGAPIRWTRGDKPQSGVVLQHAYGERVKVRNDRTDRELWVSFFDVMEAYK